MTADHDLATPVEPLVVDLTGPTGSWGALTDPNVGLSGEEASRRAGSGLANVLTASNRRTLGDIVKANVFTRFNAILGALLLIVLATGEYPDALFGIVLVMNAVIGIIQELRAKRALDRLSVVVTPRVKVVRDGQVAEVRTEEVVEGDVIDLTSGDQVPVDGTVLTSDNLEVDESLLTGESEPVAKMVASEVLSGSFVVAGQGRCQATAVGDRSFAGRLAGEALRFAPVKSELRGGTDLILKIGVWVMVPAGVLLLISQLRSASTISEGLRGAVAGVGAIVPEGLVLLTSVAFAVGVMRLGKRNALLQELAAVETLARVDTVLLDKTGTLTSGSLQVAQVEGADGEAPDELTLAALGALAATEDDPNETMRSIATLGKNPEWPVQNVIPFASARKWSGATFDGNGSWVIGAPEVLLRPADAFLARAETFAASGLRVLVLAKTSESLTRELPESLEPVALVCLEERIRTEAAETISYFIEQGVDIKVISGDNPTTVGYVAAQVGVPGAELPVDARELTTDLVELAETMESTSVFGRVQPHQKRDMVRALQARGHVVAMTGDGVNDVLALKEADMGVAMGSGAGASRAVAQLILVDDSFASMPSVVGEGRRVIANIERVAKLFVTKSVYAALLAIAVGIAQWPFPFFPRHLTIISSLTIGIPAFFLALAPNRDPHRPGFVGRIARFAVPAGSVAAAATFAGYALVGHEPGVTLTQQRTSAVIVLFLVAGWTLVILARPFDEWLTALMVSMAGAFVLIMALPATREFFELELPPLVVTLSIVGVAAIAVALLEAGWRLLSWIKRKRSGEP